MKKEQKDVYSILKKIPLIKLLSLIVFLVVLSILNVIKWENPFYIQILAFLNKYILLIITFSLLFYLGDLFSFFKFPINTPSPLFYAFGSIALTKFIFSIFYLISGPAEIIQILKFFEYLASAIIFFVILIFEYIEIFRKSNLR